MRNLILSIAVLAGAALGGARAEAAPVRIEAGQGVAQVESVQYYRPHRYGRPHYRPYAYRGWHRHGYGRPYGYARRFHGRPYYAGPIYRPHY